MNNFYILKRISLWMLTLPFIFKSNTKYRSLKNSTATANRQNSNETGNIIFKDYCQDLVYCIFEKKDIKQFCIEELSIYVQKINEIFIKFSRKSSRIDIRIMKHPTFLFYKRYMLRLQQDQKLLENETNNIKENAKLIENTKREKAKIATEIRDKEVENPQTKEVVIPKKENWEFEAEYNFNLLKNAQNNLIDQLTPIIAIINRMAFYHSVFKYPTKTTNSRTFFCCCNKIGEDSNLTLKEQIFYIKLKCIKRYNTLISISGPNLDQIPQLYLDFDVILRNLLYYLYEIQKILNGFDLTKNQKCVNKLINTILKDCVKALNEKDKHYYSIFKYHESFCKNMKQTDLERIVFKRNNLMKYIEVLIQEKIDSETIVKSTGSSKRR